MGVDFYDLSTTGGEISSQRQVIIIPSFFFLFFFFGSLFRSYEIILECRDCTSSLFFLFRIEKEKSECPQLEITRPVSIIRIWFLFLRAKTKL